MLLKSLELQGFKTFPDKTTLRFERGITSVVGPNGSGKSNISDAMRWVLGEQSVRTLRCSKMEDVIFNGTPQRKALGFAEVTLTIDNADRRLPFDNDTVAVTRRYYRSGESEYLINKNTVRLKDINELFMDTGLGRDGYSIIGQGKIDSIVAARSEDRREIFEEAAGNLIGIFGQYVVNAQLSGYRLQTPVHLPVIPACQHQRQNNIVPQGEGIQQIKLLKHKAQIAPAECRQLRLPNAGKASAIQEHLTAGGAVQGSQDIQQRGLSRAGLAHNGHIFPLLHRKGHVGQRLDPVASKTGGINLF